MACKRPPSRHASRADLPHKGGGVACGTAARICTATSPGEVQARPTLGLFPPPLWGRVREGGDGNECQATCSTSPRWGEVAPKARVRGQGPFESHLPPHPTPLPKGEREQTEFAAAPSLFFCKAARVGTARFNRRAS